MKTKLIALAIATSLAVGVAAPAFARDGNHDRAEWQRREEIRRQQEVRRQHELERQRQWQRQRELERRRDRERERAERRRYDHDRHDRHDRRGYGNCGEKPRDMGQVLRQKRDC